MLLANKFEATKLSAMCVAKLSSLMTPALAANLLQLQGSLDLADACQEVFKKALATVLDAYKVGGLLIGLVSQTLEAHWETDAFNALPPKALEALLSRSGVLFPQR
jgi:hypothetical protein